MKTQKTRRRAKRQSPSVTPEMAGQIKAMIINLGMMQHDVAARFGINQGRVSEIMNNHAFAEVPPAPLTDFS